MAQFNSVLEVCNCDSCNIYDKSYDAISFHEVAAVTVGQNFGTVVVSEYAQYLKRSPTEKLLELDISRKVQSVMLNSCNKLCFLRML